MEIEELTEDEVNLILLIRFEASIFAMGVPPPGHPKQDRAETYQKTADKIHKFEKMGFVKDITGDNGPHRMLKHKKDQEEGFPHQIYTITELGMAMWGSYAEHYLKEGASKPTVQ